MRHLTIITLTVLLCGAVFSINFHGNQLDLKAEDAETICFTDISGSYVFIKNLSETERMFCSLQDYLGDNSIQIQPCVPDDAVYYAESTWDPAWAAALSGGRIYCVEAWNIFKNGKFQKTSYLVGRI